MQKEKITFEWEVFQDKVNGLAKSFYTAGTANKKIIVDWGDGKKSEFKMHEPEKFKLHIKENNFSTHTYKKPGEYNVIIECEDIETEIIDFVASSQSITQVDLTNAKSLRYAILNFNKIIEIDLSSNILLEYIHLAQNQIKEINFFANAEIKDISIRGNKIQEIDLTTNLKLRNLDVQSTSLIELDLLKNVDLEYLSFSKFTNKIDLSKQMKLKTLVFFENSIDDIILPKLGIRKNLPNILFFE